MFDLNGGNGICDDYDSDLDATVTDEWVEGQVRMVMETASTIEMSIELGTTSYQEMNWGFLILT